MCPNIKLYVNLYKKVLNMTNKIYKNLYTVIIFYFNPSKIFLRT